MAKPEQADHGSIPTKHAIFTFQCRLLAWYRTNRRRYYWRKPSATAYVRIVSEVFLQRTRADTVAGFAPSFLRKYPSWSKLASASEQELQEDLRPIGLWRRKASSLSRLASSMSEKHGWFPENRSEIESLPSVGQYIANAVLLFCHNQAEPLLDANMARVLERHFGPRVLADIRHDPYLQLVAKQAVSCDDPASMNWAILDLASLVCTRISPNHACCPIANTCRYFQLDQRSTKPPLA